MFSSYSAANYKVKSFLTVVYDQEVEETAGSGFIIKLTRTARKRYAWLNMTVAAASACKAAMDAKYMRSFAAWTYSVNDYGAVTITQASVTERKTSVDNVVTSCGSRDVEVSVNETDVKYVNSATQKVANPASHFSSENARDYDENVRAKTIDGIPRYNGSNCAVTRDLDVRYSSRKMKTSAGTAYWQYTRYATKSYAFIGMTQAVAEDCVTAKLSQYTRDYGAIDSSGSTVASFNRKRTKIGASVQPNYNGHTWSVAVEVSETDVKASASNVSPATLFATENGRNYDGSSALVLNSVTRSGTVGIVSYSANFEDFDPSALSFEYRTEDSTEWTAQQMSGSTVVLPEEGGLTCRLVYKSYESNTITVS